MNTFSWLTQSFFGFHEFGFGLIVFELDDLLTGMLSICDIWFWSNCSAVLILRIVSGRSMALDNSGRILFSCSSSVFSFIP